MTALTAPRGDGRALPPPVPQGSRQPGRLIAAPAVAIATVLPIVLPIVMLPLLGVTIPAAAAQPWKDCSFNGRTLPCRDRHGPAGTVRITWSDGKAMTYRLIRAGFPFSTLRDSLGGLWEREILIQGNAVFLNQANGNRIVVPLR